MELLDEILNEMEEDRPLRGTPSNSFGAGLMNHSGQQKAYNALKDWSGELSMVGESFDDFDRQLLAEPHLGGSQLNPNMTVHGRLFQGNASVSGLWNNNGMTDIAPREEFPLHQGQEDSVLVSRPEALRPPPRLNLSHFAYNPTKKHDERQSSPLTPTKSYAQSRKNRRGTKSKFDPAKDFVDVPTIPLGPRARLTRQPNQSRPTQGQTHGQGAIALNHAPPVVQGITLIPVTQLPDRLRQIFSFELFNAIQSKTFQAVYESNDNVVVSAPTGSGKTTVMELAICRLIGSAEQGSYKVIYQAPTKALCSEKKRDWDRKFSSLGLVCTELTGDTDYHHMSHVKNGDIIITTPEKWDSMTRRWRDHKKLLQMVKLFLVDEIHMLKESRGATLEVVITRMKSIGAEVRFVALSATVPNSQDIATWLGKNCAYPNNPAYEARFDEEFRPVKLQKFVYGYNGTNNEFVFDKSLDKMDVLPKHKKKAPKLTIYALRLPDIIKKHSAHKPMMVFCMTRQMCQSTAKMLAEHWSKGGHLWPAPGKNFSFRDKDLHSTALSGVAFHHAGLDQNDRILVEKLFLEGSIFVICCTSTLAVGINMPAYLVILKNTCTFSDGRPKEYDDLEVMQMLGRAGRPQFDTAGVAVIMTKQENKDKYERMIAGTELIESCLHENLVEHLNAEIVMGTITDVNSAKLWLKSTYLWVRMKRNPSHYKIEGQTIVMDIEQKLDEICEKDVSHLQEAGMVYQAQEGKLSCTAAGTAMATYYLKLETMKRLLALGYGSKIADILQGISEAQEFKELRMRANERAVFREINKGLGMRFPLKGDISTTAHKANILIQFELGAMDYPVGDAFQKYSNTLMQDKNFVFQHVHRLIRCLIDCVNETKDAIALKNALELARCFSARCWENSPNQLRQLDGIGPVTVKKLALANIRNLADLTVTEAHKIDMIASRNPPFGANVLKQLANIPTFSIKVTQISKTANKKDPVKVICRANIGFTNRSVPTRFKGSIIIAYFLAECRGNLLDFRRVSVDKLQGGREVNFTAEISSPEQTITCYISCESIVGTLQSAELVPDIDKSLFPPTRQTKIDVSKHDKVKISKQKQTSADFAPASYLITQEETTNYNGPSSQDYEEYDGDDFVAALKDLDFSYIDSIGKKVDDETVRNTKLNSRSHGKSRSHTLEDTEIVEEPIQLINGNWACKHKCGDKTKCKHICCREGLEKPPKIPKKKPSTQNEIVVGIRSSLSSTGTEKRYPVDAAADYLPQLSQVKRIRSSGSSDIVKHLQKGGIDFVDLSNGEWQQDRGINESAKTGNPLPINRVHNRVSITNQPRYSYDVRTQPDLSVLMANEKVSEGSNVLPLNPLSSSSTATTINTSQPFLFGSDDFTDGDLDSTLAVMTEPVTSSPWREDQICEADTNASLLPAIQLQDTHRNKRECFVISPPEQDQLRDVDPSVVIIDDEMSTPHWDTSPNDIQPLPGRSRKRIRSTTPDSPSLNRSARFRVGRAESSRQTQDTEIAPKYLGPVAEKTIDQDLLEFLGDCVEFI